MKLKINFKQTRATSAGDINSPNLLVFIYFTVTEDEIFNGILKLSNDVADHCLCFVRIIEDLTDHLDHSKAWRFIDMLSTDSKMIDSEAQLILSQLRDEKITQKLQNFNITRLAIIIYEITVKPVLRVLPRGTYKKVL